MSPTSSFRALPSTQWLLEHPRVTPWLPLVGREKVLQEARKLLDETRHTLRQGQEPPSREVLAERLAERLAQAHRVRLRPVINATGVLLHTNLGRAPLSPEALDALLAVARHYSNLEYDLERGRRGSRLDHVVELLRDVTGGEDGLVVNNNAAAVLLVLQALARRRRVLIARTQLVEIGGGFRIPEILKQSGAKLVEVGTTNRVHLQDYLQALETQPIALVLWVHRSNFRIVGFHREPSLEELASLAHERGLPLVADVGSGALFDTQDYGLPHEPTVQECLQAGADLVCFSGDKLLGGPQAGIIVGRADLVARLRKHPLYRALRPDKLALAALEATLRIYRRGTAREAIPLWRMMALTPEELRQRAQRWRDVLGMGQVQSAVSTVGGGSLPEATLPTYVLALRPRHPTAFLARLRAQEPPIIARIENDAVLFDPRTVFPEQEEALLAGIRRAWPGETDGLPATPASTDTGPANTSTRH